MPKVIKVDFAASAKPKPKSKVRSSLCANGHHKWRVIKNSQFDVKQGKLVTVYECERCQRRKNKLQ